MSSVKTAFLFPGQGSHFVGMGKDLLRDENPLFTTLLEAASDFTSLNLKNTLLNGPKEELVKATSLQPLISAVSLGYWSILNEGGIVADTVMGHSLGEITSLGATAVVSPEIAVEMAAFRGQLMDESASLCGGGSMRAVLMASAEDAKRIIDEAGIGENCFVANDNAPNQVVVSGLESALDKFELAITNEMRVKVQPIDVAGPWHTPFITTGFDKFGEWVKNIEFKIPQSQFLMNATAKFESDPQKIKELVTGQLIKPVYWRESLQTLLKDGNYKVYEMGPGKLLSGLLRANRVSRKLDSLELAGSVSECRALVK
jgi:[acyl-carrier-protein] S-malonyltransferase